MPTLNRVLISIDEIQDALYKMFGEKRNWNSNLTSNVGHALIDMIAGVGENAGFNTITSFRETFIQLARRETSIYAGARFLGVRIPRGSSGSVQTELLNSSSEAISIPAYTQFDIEGKKFFNRVGIRLLSGQTKTLDMYSGQVRVTTKGMAGVDLRFPTVNLGLPGFVVSDTDLQVNLLDSDTGNSQLLTPNDGSIFEWGAGAPVFADQTTPEGDVALMFGDGSFGIQLQESHVLQVRYIELPSNPVTGLSDQRVKTAFSRDITGVTTEAIVPGASRHSAEYIQAYAPHMFNSRKSIVRPAQWLAAVRSYPGVADAVVEGQRDLNPNDFRFMNIVRITVLPQNSDTWGGANPNPDSAMWRAFTEWLSMYHHPRVQVLPNNAERIFADLDVVVAVSRNVTDLAALRTEIEGIIRDKFARRSGTLGRRLSVSDIVDSIKFDGDTRRTEIDYVEIKTPKDDIVPERNVQYIALRRLNLNVKYTERETV